jgi:hypothetical protein
MRAFLTFLEEQDEETGDRLFGTRSVTVEIPDVPIAEVGWPAAILLAHFAWGTPNPIPAEMQPQPEPDEE